MTSNEQITKMKKPPVVSAEEWKKAWEKVLIKEKEHTRARDALAAARRGCHFINNRGDEAMGSAWSYLNVTPLGRQEDWEESPKDYPQTPHYKWWRRHDVYSDEDARWTKWLIMPL